MNSTGSKLLRYSTMMIVTYLVVYYWTGSGTIIKSTGEASSNIIKSFQGR